MPEFNFLKYTIKIDKQTKAVQDVKQELKGVEQQTGKIGTAAGKTSGAFSSMGSIVKGLGVAAMLAVVTRQAFKGSDSLQQMASEALSMVSTITKALEPAFAVLARTMKGFSAIITGLVEIIKNNLISQFKFLIAIGKAYILVLKAAAQAITLDFKGAAESLKESGKLTKDAFTDMGKAIKGNFVVALNAGSAALEGFSGSSKIIMKQTVDNMLSEMVRNLKDTKLKGGEKLAIIAENETKLLALLKQTGDFRQGDNDTQTTLQEGLLRVFATEREAAEREVLNQTTKNAAARLKLSQAIAKQTLADEEATTEQKLEALAEAFELENEVIDANAEQRFESDEAIEATKLEAKLRFQEAIAKVNEADADSAENTAARKIAAADVEFKKTKALFEAKIGAAANAAAMEFALNKNVGSAARAAAAQAIKDEANRASRIIAITGAEATAKALRNPPGPPFSIPQAVATAVAYTALAATVAAVGGAVAAKVAPPSGGGAGAAPVAPEGPLGGPAPVELIGDGGGGAAVTAAAVAGPAGGALAGAEIGQLVINIENVSDRRYIDILIDNLNEAVLNRGQRLVATEVK